MDKEEAIKNNAEVLATDGIGLNYKYRSYVEARDPKRGVILLGGLGGMGVGSMWFKEDTEDYKKYPGYAEAKIVDTGNQPLFGIKE